MTYHMTYHMTCYYRYLLDLDYLGDPAWECIQQMDSWIIGLFKQCKDNYQQLIPPGKQ